MSALDNVMTTLGISIAIATTLMFFIMVLVVLRKVKAVGTGAKAKQDYLSKIRLLVVFLPLFWVIINYNSDTNALAETLYEDYIPLVLALILALTLFELAMPFLSQEFRRNRERGKKITRKGAGR